jgi:hypothetical protein
LSFTHQFSCMVASHSYRMGKITNRYWVVEGTHTDPNDQDTLDHNTQKQYGPYENEILANNQAMSLIQKNVDDFYHRAWVISK